MIVSKHFVLTLSTGMLCGFLTFYMFGTLVSSPAIEIFNNRTPYNMHNNAELHLNLPVGQFHGLSKPYHEGEGTEAERLAEKVRVVCWIMTSPSNHEKKAKHVKATWARHCNYHVFISSKSDKELGSIAVTSHEGRDYLWEKTKDAFKYLMKHYYDKADWFLKADDDTYVIVENLRYMLSPYDPNDPLWFGCRFKTFVKKGYMSGGAGYVLSKEAARKFVTEALPNKLKCRHDSHGAEDVEMGKCLQNVGVEAIDSRDSEGRGRFFPFNPVAHLIPGQIEKSSWFWDWTYYPSPVGINCCSDTAIAFHYIPPDKMYEMEYMLYHLRPYGVQQRAQFPPEMPADFLNMPPEVGKKYIMFKNTQTKVQQNETIKTSTQTNLSNSTDLNS